MNYFDIISELNEKYIDAHKILIEQAVNARHASICCCTRYLNVAKRVEKALICMILAGKEYDNNSIVISHDYESRSTLLTNRKTAETIIIPFIVGTAD